MIFCLIFATVAAELFNSKNSDYCLPPIIPQGTPTEIVHYDSETVLACPLRMFPVRKSLWFFDGQPIIFDTYFFRRHPTIVDSIIISDILKHTVVLSCKAVTPCGNETSPNITVYYSQTGISIQTIHNITNGGIVFRPMVPFYLIPDFFWDTKFTVEILRFYQTISGSESFDMLFKEIDGNLYLAYLDYDRRVFYYLNPGGMVKYILSPNVVKTWKPKTPTVVYPYGRTILVKKGSSPSLIPCFFYGRYSVILFGRGNVTKPSDSLNLTNVTYKDSGSDYWCSPSYQMFWRVPELEATYSIRVYDPISFPVQVLAHNISEGQTLNVSCEPKSGFPKPEFRWMVNDVEYDPLQSSYIRQNGVYGLTIDWRAGPMSLKCRLKNEIEDVTLSMYIKVMTKLSPVLSVPSSITLRNVTNLHINCSVTGSPVRKTIVYWRINDELLSNKHEDLVVESGHERDLSDSYIVLFIDAKSGSMRKKDEVTCVADDGFRQNLTKTVIYYQLGEPFDVKKCIHLKELAILWVPLSALLVFIFVVVSAICYRRMAYHNYDLSTSEPISVYKECREKFMRSTSDPPFMDICDLKTIPKMNSEENISVFKHEDISELASSLCNNYDY